MHDLKFALLAFVNICKHLYAQEVHKFIDLLYSDVLFIAHLLQKYNMCGTLVKYRQNF